MIDVAKMVQKTETIVDFNSMKIINFSRLKCSQNCRYKSNSPIFKMMQVLGCYRTIPPTLCGATLKI
jgi:hypothetical protein